MCAAFKPNYNKITLIISFSSDINQPQTTSKEPTINACDGLSCDNGAKCFIDDNTRKPTCRYCNLIRMFTEPNTQGRTQGRGFGGRNPSILEVKAMLLMADIVRELSRDNIYSGSNQSQQSKFDKSSKIGHFSLLTLSELPSLKISGCAPDNTAEFVHRLFCPNPARGFV